jgi:hypothetical protein
VLRFSGTVLGHYDGLQQSFLNEPTLAAALDQMNLRDWLVLFDSDLSRLWDRRRKWASLDESLMLNRHVERLFWQYQLFPWRTDEGQIRIEAPLFSDAAQLAGIRPGLRRVAALAKPMSWLLTMASISRRLSLGTITIKVCAGVTTLCGTLPAAGGHPGSRLKAPKA